MEINLTLRFHSPLNIGSGLQQGTLAKQPLLKDRQGWPYLPASTLKGRLRHACERVAQALRLTICHTHHDMCRDKQDPCPICSIFGAPWHPGRGRFRDLTLSGPDYVLELQKENRPPLTTERTGTAINRRRGTVESGMLYSTELLFSGVPLEFSGVISGDFTLAQQALLEAGLRELFSIGRAKSRGLGWFELALTRPEEGAAPEELLAALEELQP